MILHILTVREESYRELKSHFAFLTKVLYQLDACLLNQAIVF